MNGIVLIKRVRIVMIDFTTQIDELRTPNTDGADDEYQSDRRPSRIHETATVHPSHSYLDCQAILINVESITYFFSR